MKYGSAHINRAGTLDVGKGVIVELRYAGNYQNNSNRSYKGDYSRKMSIWTAKVITSIPSIFPGALGHSVIGQALKEGKWALEVINLREFANDERGSIDDSPFGGGPGMILRPDVVEKAIKKALENVETDLPLVYMTPVGKPLIQKRIKEQILATGKLIGILRQLSQ